MYHIVNFIGIVIILFNYKCTSKSVINDNIIKCTTLLILLKEYLLNYKCTFNNVINGKISTSKNERLYLK